MEISFKFQPGSEMLKSMHERGKLQAALFNMKSAIRYIKDAKHCGPEVEDYAIKTALERANEYSTLTYNNPYAGTDEFLKGISIAFGLWNKYRPITTS